MFIRPLFIKQLAIMDNNELDKFPGASLLSDALCGNPEEPLLDSCYFLSFCDSFQSL